MDKPKKILILQRVLRLMAIVVLKKYNPRIISVTGSVGKTSTKEAIFTVLASHFRVKRSEKNYNNEIGIPLTIIGVCSGQRSVLKWIGVFLKWLVVVVLPVEYPEILILEMGADRPGDIQYLIGFIKSEVGVITDISMSHIEFFKNLDEVAKTKGALVKELGDGGLAVLNIDNPEVEKLKEQVSSNLVTIGFSEKADMQATDMAFVYSGEGGSVRGLSFKLNYKGTSMPVRLNNVLAKHQIYPALIAASIGVWFGLNLIEVATALENFSSPCGRMNLIDGIKGSLLIDDTYNASPTSTLAALETFKDVATSRKIIVLGDMFELGGETEKAHRNVARKINEIGGDVFIAVGKNMEFAIEELLKIGFVSENVFRFSNPVDAGKKLQNILRESDLVLIKGSQGMRMEKVVEEVMQSPQKADELLCRQNEEWKKINFVEA
jgi:UDP-N-acetylmuramoyl-tripeptide--D-alanyl-D-alanine ligase